MDILLNGKALSLDDGLYLNMLITHLELSGKRLAVEINREIIPKSEHEQYRIQDGDTIEIVYAIGGG